VSCKINIILGLFQCHCCVVLYIVSFEILILEMFIKMKQIQHVV